MAPAEGEAPNARHREIFLLVRAVLVAACISSQVNPFPDTPLGGVLFNRPNTATKTRALAVGVTEEVTAVLPSVVLDPLVSEVTANAA